MSEKEDISKYKLHVGTHHEGGRLRSEYAEEMIKYNFTPRLESEKVLFKDILQYNKAHILMLTERGVVTEKDAKIILKELDRIESEGIDHFVLDPKLEDIYPNIEAILIKRLGEGVGGQLLTGRTRGDAQLTPNRAYNRRKLLDVMEENTETRETLIKIARKHVDTVIPGYTFLQLAQPTSFAHHVLSLAEALEADFQRLNGAYTRMNLSPAEVATGWGTSFPIDRERVAELLGFDGVLENCRYAITSQSVEIEALSAMALMMTNIGRFSEDLYYWFASELKGVDWGDEWCVGSYFMPQKRNPTSLDHVRDVAVEAIAAVNYALEQFRVATVIYGGIGKIHYIARDVEDAVIGGLRIFRGTVSGIVVNKREMRDRAGAYFAQAVELAETLVKEKNLSFRTAHSIVGTLVARAIDNRLKPRDVTPAMLDEAALELTGKPIELSPESLKNALDVAQNVRGRKVLGGTAPEVVRNSIRKREKATKEDKEAFHKMRMRLKEAEDSLSEAVKKMVG